MPSFCFQDLGSSLVSLLWILFQGDCRSPLHLIALVLFYLAPLSATYFFVISFCLTFCVCGVLSAGCRTLVLASDVCCLVGEVALGAKTIIRGGWATQVSGSCQAPLSIGFSRQEHWSGCYAFLQGIFPTQGLNSHFLQLLHCRQILPHWATGEPL